MRLNLIYISFLAVPALVRFPRAVISGIPNDMTATWCAHDVSIVPDTLLRRLRVLHRKFFLGFFAQLKRIVCCLANPCQQLPLRWIWGDYATMCCSIKYPYLPHRWDFYKNLTPLCKFQLNSVHFFNFLVVKTPTPPPRNF